MNIDEKLDSKAEFILSKLPYKEGERRKFSFGFHELLLFIEEWEKWKVEQLRLNRNIPITIDEIAEIICDHFNKTLVDIRRKSQKHEFVIVRYWIMYFSREHTKQSLSQIGLFCGKKDHATVKWGLKTISNLLSTEIEAVRTLDEIKVKISERKVVKKIYVPEIKDHPVKVRIEPENKPIQHFGVNKSMDIPARFIAESKYADCFSALV